MCTHAAAAFAAATIASRPTESEHSSAQTSVARLIHEWRQGTSTSAKMVTCN